MANSFFRFKQFIIHQDRSAMKVTTDGCLFGALIASNSLKEKSDVLDIGGGTGLLSLMFAQKHNDSIIDVIEIDANASEQAKENIRLSDWNDRIQLIHADANGYVFSKNYDLIFSNPPFYETEIESSDHKKNIAHHSSGLLIADLCVLIKNNLKADGTFFLLLAFKREKHVEKALKENQLFMHEKIRVRQSTKHAYFRMIISGGHSGSVSVKESEISICNNQMQYTEEFIALLKDYYLNL